MSHCHHHCRDWQYIPGKICSLKWLVCRTCQQSSIVWRWVIIKITVIESVIFPHMEASSENCIFKTTNWVTIQQRQTNISKEITHWQTWTESMNLDKIKPRSEQKKNLFFFKRCVLRPELKTFNVYTLRGKSIREFQRVDPEKKKHLPNFSCLMFGTERRAK